MKLSIVALLMMVAAILEPSVSNPMLQSAGYALLRKNQQCALCPLPRNNQPSAAYPLPMNNQPSAAYPLPWNNQPSRANPLPRNYQSSAAYPLPRNNQPSAAHPLPRNNQQHPQYPPTPVRQDGRQRNMAPSKGPPTMSAGTFTGNQSGSALSQGETITDSRTQGTRSHMQGGMVGSGKLQGTVKTKSNNGNNAQSGYAGELEGKGLMSTDTVAYSDGRGAGSRTAVKGNLVGAGTISGGSSAGSTGGYNDAFWKKK